MSISRRFLNQNFILTLKQRLISVVVTTLALASVIFILNNMHKTPVATIYPLFRRDDGRDVLRPPECFEWRKIAYQKSKLRLYREHFLSHDVTDWFLYAALFNEEWHRSQKHHPVYLDIAANHARRWSSTWFFDRCMDWEGICVEPNKRYKDELTRERTCQLVTHCISDRPRIVNFSKTAAYGGVVVNFSSTDASERVGVNGALHKSDFKYRDQFDGIEEMRCETVQNIFEKLKLDKVHINFLSLDVEGHELPVLKGINWNQTSIDVIVIENRSDNMRTFLSNRNYRLFEILKDDIWISRESILKPDKSIVKWMSTFDRQNYLFH